MTSLEKHQQTFADHLPDMERMAAAAFRHLDPERREEAVQNTLALTWKGLHALILKGRADEPGILNSILWYSIRQTRVGRRPQGTEAKKAKDAMTYRGRGKVRFEHVELHLLVADTTPVPEAVSFRIDVPAFLATLSDRQERMAYDLASGMTTKDCAAKFKVTPGAVSQFRQRFKDKFEVFMAG